MPAEADAGPLPGARFLPDVLAATFGVSPSEVVGRPLAIGFRVRVEPRGVFVSGVVADLVAAAAKAHGWRAVVVERCDDQPADAVVSTCGELWVGGVGAGPVAVDHAGGGADERRVLVPAGDGAADGWDRSTRIAALRADFARTADRLDRELAADVRWDALRTVEPTGARWLRAVTDDVAGGRRAVGSYLIDRADEFDDERIDQLGDGYVRVSALWRELGRVGPAVGPELQALERTCAAWMRGAAQRPTRYAF